MAETEAYLQGECMYSSDEKHMNQKGWYQAKATVQTGAVGEGGRLPQPSRAICCPEHYTGLSAAEKENWEPIPDP